MKCSQVRLLVLESGQQSRSHVFSKRRIKEHFGQNFAYRRVDVYAIQAATKSIIYCFFCSAHNSILLIRLPI